MQQRVMVLDFGGQYNQLIARRVRQANVYSEIFSYTTSIKQIKEYNPAAVILTGGPKSVYEDDAPQVNRKLFELGIPILGICYGNHIMCQVLGGKVKSAKTREYGYTDIALDENCRLFKGIDNITSCWMSHTDQIESVPKGFITAAKTDTCPIAAMYDEEKKLYSVQFHPEVRHTKHGQKMLENFLFEICSLKKDWTMKNFADESIRKIKRKVGNKKVLLALSGGVDSSVAAVLLSKAIGKNLTCIFVDHGLLRKDEGDEVERMFAKGYDFNLIRINAESRFLMKLKNITDPEEKRKIIGREFIRVFEEQANKLGHIHFLAQGTIYPDVVESGQGHSAVIKSHHNVGGLPDVVDFDDIIEPLRELFKDEVRRVGLEIGLEESLVWRQPFPGPGLAIRIIGDITKEKLDILREADFLFRKEISNAALERDIWQYFAVLTNIRTVGVMGDARTYDYVLALRAVSSVDAMTADWSHIPYEVLAKISNTIINEVSGINRVVYDITSKPPGTIEWE